MRTAKEIRHEIRQLKKEMKERGIKVTSFMNRQPSLDAARANERLFALKAELQKATVRATAGLMDFLTHVLRADN